MDPALTDVTVNVLPEMEAVNAGATGAAMDSKDVLATVCEELTVYVPTPPLPVPTAVTTVPAAIPGPTMGDPTASVPAATALTVSVVPEMEPVNEAAGASPTTVVEGTLCGTAIV